MLSNVLQKTDEQQIVSLGISSQLSNMQKEITYQKNKINYLSSELKVEIVRPMYEHDVYEKYIH